VTSRTLRVLPWFAILAACWLALFPISSVDAYYHLATGRRILDDREIPARGVGSATFGHVPWHDNEWGFQVLAALVGRAEREPGGVLVLTPAGRVGLVLMRAGALAAALSLVAATMARCGVGAVLRALGVWLAAFLTFGNLFWDIRPQILSYVALAALAFLLELERDGRRWALPACLAVIALWANFHGAFVVGIGLLACEAAGGWLEARRDATLRPYAWRLTASTLGAPLAACLNPLGFRQLVHPLVYMAHPEIYAGNNEWMRPDFLHLPLMLATFGLLALALATGARLRPGHLLRVVLFGALFLTAIRHLPLVTIVVVPVLALAATEAGKGPGWRAFWDPGSVAGIPRRSRAVLVLLVLAGIAGLSGAKFIGVVPRFDERPSRALPEAHVRFLAAHAVRGNGFNAYGFGGFLMFRMYPQERVFMDGRNDLYGTFRARVYNRILFTEPGWGELWTDAVARYDIGWVLVDGTDPLAAALANAPEWRRVPDDRLSDDRRFGADGIVLFLADTVENRAILSTTTAGCVHAETKPSS
jgi:hypothetical protein